MLRATVIGDPHLPSDGRTVAHFFNTAAFLPASRMTRGHFGTSGRDILTGPSFSQWDIALLKNFRFGKRYNFQFRGESFNVFNHPSFTNINTTVRFDNASNPKQGFGAVTASGPGRIFQLGLKLLF